jgi:mercuric ion transport protein
MSGRDTAAVVGVGAVACAACCAGPIIGFFAALGLGAAAGFALFGTVALVAAATVALFVLRRRRRGQSCATGTDEWAGAPVAVPMPTVRAPG